MAMRFLLSFLLTIILVQSVQADIRFLTIADIHYGNKNIPGDGHDTGNILLTVAMNKFSQLANQVDFILALGDFPAHQLIHSSKKVDYIKTVFRGWVAFCVVGCV
jgi:hypothetical protein